MSRSNSRTKVREAVCNQFFFFPKGMQNIVFLSKGFFFPPWFRPSKDKQNIDLFLDDLFNPLLEVEGNSVSRRIEIPVLFS